MIKIYEEQSMNLNELQKELGLAHYTLYKYAKGKSNIESMGVGTFLEMCKLLKEDPFVLYEKIKEYLEKVKK